MRFVASMRRIVESLPAGETPGLSNHLLCWCALIFLIRLITQKQNHFPGEELEKLQFERRQKNAHAVPTVHESTKTARIVWDALRARYPAIPSGWELCDDSLVLMAAIIPVVV